MHIKNSKSTGRRYIVILIKNSANNTNRPIVKGLFSVLEVF